MVHVVSALYQFQGEEPVSVVAQKLVVCGQIRVAQGGGEAELTPEAFQPDPPERPALQELEGYGFVRLPVAGRIDDRKLAATELSLD